MAQRRGAEWPLHRRLGPRGWGFWHLLTFWGCPWWSTLSWCTWGHSRALGGASCPASHPVAVRQRPGRHHASFRPCGFLGHPLPLAPLRLQAGHQAWGRWSGRRPWPMWLSGHSWGQAVWGPAPASPATQLAWHRGSVRGRCPQPACSPERDLGPGAASPGMGVPCRAGHPPPSPGRREQGSPAALGRRSLERVTCSGGRQEGSGDPKNPLSPHQPRAGKQEAGTAFSPHSSLAWDGSPLAVRKQVQPSPSPQAAWAGRQAAAAVPAERCVPALGAFLPSPASSGGEGAGEDGSASCCTQAAAWLGEGAGEGQGLPDPSPALSEHRVPWSTILPGADLRHREQYEEPSPWGAGTRISSPQGIKTSTESARPQGVTGASSPTGHRNPQPVGALGQARCWESRISTHAEQPWVWPHS